MSPIELLLSTAQIAGPENPHAIDDLGRLIDAAEDEADIATLASAIAIADRWLEPEVRCLNRLAVEFYRANAFLGLFNAKVSIRRISSSDWEQPDLENGLLALRRVIANPEFEAWPSIRKAQANTNLGNAHSTLGRPVDALICRDAALRHVPGFGMAIGTRAETLDALAGSIFRGTARKVLLASAAYGFEATRSDSAIFEANYDVVREKWTSREKELRQWLNDSGWPDISPYAEHVNPSEESDYVQWCLDRRLMLNAVNEVGTLWLAGNDHLHLSPMRTTAISADLMGMFDTMLSEYAAARWSIYESIQIKSPAIDALLRPHDTGDAPQFGLAAERAKSSFRAAYSILDRVAFFLNAYLGIGLKAGDVSFSRLWRQSNGAVRADFRASQNWALRGLYFISRDLFEAGYQEGLAPDAQVLATIRNRLEHRYVRVIDRAVSPGEVESDLIYRVGINDLQNKTLRLLQLTRAALIALVGAVHIKERSEAEPGVAYTKLPILKQRETAT